MSTTSRQRLETQWQAYDAACDHRAVMSLSYLHITRELRRQFAAGAFQDPEWMAFVVAEFSNEYFKAIADYDAGRPVAPAWKVALDAMTKGDATAIQDMLLFSQAHVGHDYPYVLASQGIRGPVGRVAQARPRPDQRGRTPRSSTASRTRSRARYDDSMGWLDLKPSPLDELLALEVVKVWREDDLAPRRAADRRRGPARCARSLDAEIDVQSDRLDHADLDADPGLAQDARREVRRRARRAEGLAPALDADADGLCRPSRAARAPGRAARRARARP